MRHLHIPFFPGRHRSGFFFILLLPFLLTEIGNLGTEEALKAAMDRYFAEHPHFRPGDHNERRVRTLIKTHLDSPRSEVEGLNSHEFPCLIGAMEDEPLYHQFLEKMQEQEQQEQTSSEAPPQPSRKRSRSRSVRPKKGLQPTSKVKPATKKMPKALAKKLEVPGPQSAAGSSSDSPRSEVPGPESTDTSSDPEPWELDTHEWVNRDCWACPDCNSMNLRFTQWCVCGTQREQAQERRTGDRDCPWCGNLIFGWRRWCPWSDCPSGDWMCPKCNNHNWARRRVCNSTSCRHPRPW